MTTATPPSRARTAFAELCAELADANTTFDAECEAAIAPPQAKREAARDAARAKYRATLAALDA